MFETDPNYFNGIRIYHIQAQRDPEDLRKQIINGLLATPLHMPPLLLWDDEGLKMFDKFSQTPSYYPLRKELEILDHHIDDIVDSIQNKSVLVELGCGSLEKTSIILSAFERQQRSVSYYALDVSIGELTSSLNNLMKSIGKTSYVEIHGLLGTYEDCVAWLAESSNLGIARSISFFWLGNSIANFHPFETSSLLSRLVDVCAKSGLSCQFIVAVDACDQESQIMTAYDTTKEPLCNFMLNGLHHANNVLDQQLFQAKDWTCSAEFDSVEHVLQLYYTPVRDVHLKVNEACVEIRKGEKICAITSGKWTEEDIQVISMRAGLQVANAWRDLNGVYCFYRLQPLV